MTRVKSQNTLWDQCKTTCKVDKIQLISMYRRMLCSHMASLNPMLNKVSKLATVKVHVLISSVVGGID